MENWFASIPLVAEGGPIVLVLYGLSLIAVAVVLERSVALRPERVLPEAWAQGILEAVDRDGLGGLGRGVGWPNVAAASALRRLIEAEADSAVALRDLAEMLAERERQGLERGLGLLALGAALAPLLGLLGTVTGMILTFRTIAEIGVGDPKLLAGGIYQALYTTAVGLAVAIPLTVIHRALRARCERLLDDMADFLESVGRAGGMGRRGHASS